MSKHRLPEFLGDAFDCPLCGVYAHMSWDRYRGTEQAGLLAATCKACGRYSVWLNQRMLHPDGGVAPLPAEDMPADVLADYQEARSVVGRSAKAAAALLRLALQRLMPHLGEPGKHLDTDIASLVAKGLSVSIQQALDTVRVVGNESVHPGEIDVSDTPEVAVALFNLLNVIVDNRITQPKKIAEIYGSLPASKLDAIKKRDGVKAKAI